MTFRFCRALVEKFHEPLVMARRRYFFCKISASAYREGLRGSDARQDKLLTVRRFK